MLDAAPDFGPPPPLQELMAAASRFKEHFSPPIKRLGVKKELTIITCMDSRVMPEQIFDLKLGDAEFIRNAGGRVTEDVIRSAVVTIELLHCKTIILMHHNDCGAQAAKKHHDQLVKEIKDKYGEDISKMDLHPIEPTQEGLEKSVVEDFDKLDQCPLIDKKVAIYGFVYSVDDGSLKEIKRREPTS